MQSKQNSSLAFQHNVVLLKITNALLFISNLTHKDIVIKTIIVVEVHTVCINVFLLDYKTINIV